MSTKLFVYVGAGSDFGIMNQTRYQKYIEAHFYDQQPAIRHHEPGMELYEPLKTIEGFLQIARKQIDVLNTHMLDENTAVIYYKTDTKRIRMITYHFNRIIQKPSDIEENVRAETYLLSFLGAPEMFVVKREEFPRIHSKVGSWGQFSIVNQ